MPYPPISTPSAPEILNPLNRLQKIPANLFRPPAACVYTAPMPSFARLRRHPGFAAFFDVVHPFFWPVLFWQLVRASKQIAALGCGESLVRVHWWGGITIAYLGDRAPDPSAYRPLAPSRPAWDDPCWSTAVPAFLNAGARAAIFPCFSGGSGRPRSGLTKGACALAARPDTS